MKHARTKEETYKDKTIAAASEGSSPSPSPTSATGNLTSDTIEAQAYEPTSVTAKDENITVAVGGQHKTAAIVDCPHLWVLDGQLVIRGMVVTGKECTELPWRRKKDGEPASQAEIAREIELVKALYIRSKVQTPADFDSTKLFLNEGIT